MSYLVFARKWRPKSFNEVIGQAHIATTLKNAISLGRVGHAYLFSGPRGIGKTSTARILAKALNCAKGPTPNPCNVCDSCREISDGRSLDVMEIDGASNRGIEQIRQLRENVKFAPAKSRFKIYIIDEVHQITTDGFNALLKTLEEPPAHVKFIFATTQAHKVLPTILSRCQRFDFRPLPSSAIVEKLKQIIKAEKLKVTEEAVLYIARSSGGSMRDAESTLDQLASFCQGQVELETVTSVLGMVDLDLLEEVSQNIIERKTPEALALIEKVINQGKDLSQFISSLMEHFRNILVTKIVGSNNSRNLIDLPQERLARISEQGKGLSLEEIFYVFNVLVRVQEGLRSALSSRVLVEMGIIKLTQRENFSSLEEILSRLAALEQRLGKAKVPVENNPGPSQFEAEPEFPQTPSGGLNENWRSLLQEIKKEKMFVATALEMGESRGIKDKVLTVAFSEKHNFYKESLEHSENKELIEAKAKKVFGDDLEIRFILDKNLGTETAQERQRLSQVSKKASAAPIIQSALKIFGGRIVKKSGE